jgi:hypothetical protein
MHQDKTVLLGQSQEKKTQLINKTRIFFTADKVKEYKHSEIKT